ncbi:hypothetical protein CSB45_10550 [candidate division KSB3 bacterium]|uniref:SH3b domain-containing protein n=1 Tax=candidate division KSB3 bacterium TaxID=2044937 RepID=A0A2G6E3L9_9BACT|nr:MAG: hypothetical protein CSB45_10550 [candidate division KSB3 bacterium]PIE29147.1 MAG: hypothetical protein CSA57_10075 [candidate division KSB3 bacterium]
MKRFLHKSCYLMLCLIVSVQFTGCRYFSKKIPPAEQFSNAEQLRKDGRLLDAVERYDTLVSQHPDSELVPPALYYSGAIKYTISGQAIGPKTLKARENGLSEGKKTRYNAWIEYMKDHQDAFSYVEGLDRYLYKGNDFKTLIEKHPSSNLVDDAAFQLIRLHVHGKQSTKTFRLDYALQLYTDYFTAYPQSPYRAKALEHLGTLADKGSAMVNNDAIGTAFKEFSTAASDLPGFRPLAYTLALSFLESGDRSGAASILGVPSVIGIGTVDTERTRLNIRSGQGTNTRIVTKVEKGGRLLLLDQSGTWYKVLLPDGTTGYAHRDFIRET